MKPSHILLLLAAVMVALPSLSIQQATSPPVPNYCDPGTPLPPPIGCPSCLGNCGLKGGQNNTKCSCDISCIVYGDCCEDFRDTCPFEVKKSIYMDARMLNKRTKCYSINLNYRSLVIDSCLDGRMCASLNRGQLNWLLPVVDVATGLQYSHAQCALCNNVQKAKPWDANIRCNNGRSYNVSTVNELNRLLASSICIVEAHGPPKGYHDRYCIEEPFAKCTSCANQELVKKCHGGTQSYTLAPRANYKNYYCALCSASGAVECGLFYDPDHSHGQPGGHGQGQVPLSIIFDFNPSNGLQVGGTDYANLACLPGEVSVPGGGCRQKTCPSDQKLVGTTCFPMNLNETVTATVKFNKSEDASEVLDYINEPKSTWDQNMAQSIQSLDDPDYSIPSVEVSAHSYSPTSFNVTSLVTVALTENGTFNETSRYKLIMTVRDKIRVGIYNLLLQFQMNPGQVQISFDNNSLSFPPWQSDCNWVLFKPSEYIHNGSHLTLSESSTSYSKGHFAIFADSALVCVLADHKVAYPEYSGPLEIVSLICTILSILCLSTRIILQLLFPYFQSFARRLQFQLCLALCMAYIFMLVGGGLNGTSPKAPCYVVGVLTYTAFLAAFGWMTAAAINTWVVFRPSARFLKANEKSQSLVTYAILGWIIPIALSILVLGLDFSTIEPHFKPGFAEPLCWISQKYALIVFFGIPVMCSMIINFILFLVIACVLRKTFEEAVTTTGTPQKEHLAVYIRLFILMGVSWSLGFIAAFTGLLPIWIIFVVLNASQGVFLFVSFVCKKSILKMIFRKLSKDDPSKSTSTSQTKSPRVHPGRDHVHIPLSGQRVLPA